MAKPLILTPELLEMARNEFENKLQKFNISNGAFNFSKTFLYKDIEKAKLWLSEKAYTKMISLVLNFDTEIAWHGVGERVEGTTNEYRITDIVVYPQSVTGATVDMDEQQYERWLRENDNNEDFWHLIMQGHSHVSMGVTPSSTDMEHQHKVLNMLTPNAFYVFMILNKKGQAHVDIYDKQSNILYNTDDIVINVENSDIQAFIAEAKTQLHPKTVVVSQPNKANTNTANVTKYIDGIKTKNKTDKPSDMPISDYSSFYRD